jgi:hypothetical protein
MKRPMKFGWRAATSGAPYSLNLSGEKIGMNLRVEAFERQSSLAGVLARHDECETGRRKMQRMMVLTAVSAVAIALVLSPTCELHAASPFAPGLQAGEALFVQAQAKAKKGPGRCGVGKYWDRKKRDCVSK